MKPDTGLDALARRDALEQQLVHVKERAAALNAREAELKAALSATDDDLRAAHAVAAREGGAPDTSALDRGRGELLAELRSLETAKAGVNDAGPATRRELASLYRSEWQQFATAAERADQEAVDLLAALEEHYRAAHAAWQRAAVMWEEPMLDYDADGPGRAVPAWPLPHPDDAFAETSRPRPVGYLTVEERKDARRPQPGTYVDVRNDQVIELETAGEVEASRERLTPDGFGFVRMRAA